MTEGLGILSIKMFVWLIIMLGLILGLSFILKRLKFSPGCGNKPPLMRLLGSLNLAPKRGIALVEVCGQWLVIGIGTENINLISKVDRPECDAVSAADVVEGKNMFHNILGNIGVFRKTPEIGDKRQHEGT